MFPLSQIAFYMSTSLYCVSFMTAHKPYESPVLNYVNFINEMFLLLTSYYLLLLTDIVPDLELRERIGWLYLYSLIFVIALNFSIMFQ